jgi:hypothetical protein
MRRTMLAVLGGAILIGGAAAAPAAIAAAPRPQAPTGHKPAKPAPKPRRHVFTMEEVGNRLSTSGPRYEDIYRVQSSPFGEGSVIRDAVLTNTVFPASGSDVAKTYDRGGRTFAKETYTFGTPNTDGVGPITGRGSCTSGTGRHLGETCTYTMKGSFNLITGITRLTLSGTYTLGAQSQPTK